MTYEARVSRIVHNEKNGSKNQAAKGSNIYIDEPRRKEHDLHLGNEATVIYNDVVVTARIRPNHEDDVANAKQKGVVGVSIDLAKTLGLPISQGIVYWIENPTYLRIERHEKK